MPVVTKQVDQSFSIDEIKYAGNDTTVAGYNTPYLGSLAKLTISGMYPTYVYPKKRTK